MPERLLHQTRIHIVTPRALLGEGISVLPTDLGAFFVLVGRVGRDPGLLLLTLRALRQRALFASLKLGDLGWILRARPRRISRWLDRLSDEGILVYQLGGGYDFDALLVEIVADTPDPAAWPIEGDVFPSTGHELPTHWFVQVLPRIGRVSFLAYLWLLGREARGVGNTAVLPERLALDLKLLGPAHARFHLGRLQRHGLLKAHPSGRGLVLLDPLPLTYAQRLGLKLRELRLLPATGSGLVALVLAVLAPLLLALYLLTHRVP